MDKYDKQTMLMYVVAMLPLVVIVVAAIIADAYIRTH